MGFWLIWSRIERRVFVISLWGAAFVDACVAIATRALAAPTWVVATADGIGFAVLALWAGGLVGRGRL